MWTSVSPCPEAPVGVASGRWFTFGDGADLPSDQRPDDAKSACFDAAPAAAETALVGAPCVTVTLRSRGLPSSTFRLNVSTICLRRLVHDFPSVY